MMIKKVFLSLTSLLIIFVLLSFNYPSMFLQDEGHGKVRWYTFGEAVEAQKKDPRPIMVDVYTNWCGPCKAMANFTFGHPIIASYLNEKFYPVKFNAETRDTVRFNNYYFVNQNPPEARRPVHDFALSILEKKMVYPSIVFIDTNIQRLQIITGFYRPEQFEPIVKFFGSGAYKTTKYEDFTVSFVGEIE